MRKLFAIAVVLLMSMMVFSGCLEKEGTGVDIGSPFIGGSIGLLLDFQEGNPPREVFDGGEFPFAATLKIENRGEADILMEDMTVRLTGIKASDFGLTDSDLILQPSDTVTRRFKDANGNVVEGTTEFITFDDLNFVGSLAGNEMFTIRGEVCYKYQTQAQSKLCFTRSLLDTTYDKVCRVDEGKPVRSSSAPIQVVNIREIPRGREKVQFTFDITHSTNGDLFKLGTDCEYKFKNENKVFVTVVTDMPGLKCSGLSDGTDSTGYVTLYNRKATVTCTQDAGEVTCDYEKILKIVLDYDIKEYRETQIIIKHAVDE